MVTALGYDGLCSYSEQVQAFAAPLDLVIWVVINHNSWR